MGTDTPDYATGSAQSIGGGLVYIQTLPVPTTGWSSGVLPAMGFSSVVVSFQTAFTNERMGMQWYDDIGATQQVFVDYWDVATGCNFVWIYPVIAPYVRVTLLPTSASQVNFLSLYGMSYAPPENTMQPTSGLLASGTLVPVVSGVEANYPITPFTGPVTVGVFGVGNPVSSYYIHSYDYEGNLIAAQPIQINSTVFACQNIALPSLINTLAIDQVTGAPRSYYYTVMA